MKCSYVENNLIGLIEKTLSQQFQDEIVHHIDNCQNCKLLVSNVTNAYTVFDSNNIVIPDLYPAIEQRLRKHHTSVIEFVPQHRIAFRIAASILVIIGMGLGVFIGGKYYSSSTSLSQTSAQVDINDYYSTENYQMDGETGLALLYTNDN